MPIYGDAFKDGICTPPSSLFPAAGDGDWNAIDKEEGRSSREEGKLSPFTVFSCDNHE